MAYTKSEFAITRVQKYLKQMEEAQSSIEWVAEEPHKLAYLIREGLSVAKKLNHPFAELSKKFILRAKAHKVVAELRVSDPSIIELQRILNKMRIEKVSTLLEVVGATIKHKADEMYFPDAVGLTYDEITRLYNWTKTNDYFIIVGDGITLSKVDPGDAKWIPQNRETMK